MLRIDLFGARSLRLALAFAAAISLITISAFGLVYLDVAREEIDRVGAILAEEVRLNAEAPEDRLRAALAARQLSEIRRIDYLTLFDAKGAVVLGNLRRMPPVAADGRPHLLDAREMSAIAAAPGTAILVARRRADGGVLVLGRSLQDNDDVERTLLRALATALAPTIALILLIGELIARQGARRLDRVQEAIGRIAKGDFTSRLPVSNERDEIDRIAVAVNLMLDEIARLLDQLRYTGDNIAHELRTPIAVARAKLERALEGECGEAEPRLKAAVDQLDRAAQTIAALLRISELENGLRERRFRDVDLTEIGAQTLEFYEPLAEEKAVRLTAALAAPVWIRGDEDLLREAVSNLVDNALKFTPAGGGVELCVSMQGGHPRLEVSDRGPGVAAVDRERIFRRFYRAPVAEGTVGQGLGLSIARMIAELHGMALRVEDNAPGARFVMTADRNAARP